MAAACMRAKGVQAVVVGADRVAANGDTANKVSFQILMAFSNLFWFLRYFLVVRLYINLSSLFLNFIF